MFPTRELPSELLTRRRWVTWRYGLPRPNGRRPKVPHVARTGRLASVVNPADWCEFEVALEACAKDSALDGVGYVFAAGDEVAGVDLDNCRDSGTGIIAGPAAQLLADLGTYAEVSPSGTGVKAFAAGALDPNGANRRLGIEVYGTGRFFTVTGNRVPGTPLEVRHAGDVLRRLQASLAPELTPRPEWTGTGFTGADDDLLRRACAAKNGAKVSAYLAGDLCGKPSHSEALLGLAQMLAFWTGPDPERLQRLVCSSQLFRTAEEERTKWFTNRGTDTWGWRYVSVKAIETCGSFYSDHKPKDPDTEDQHLCKNGVPFGTVESLFESIKSEPIPVHIEKVVRSRKRSGLMPKRWLAVLCFRLAGHGGEFFLSGNVAGRLLGVDRATVSKWLGEFAKLKLIKRVSWGNSFNGLANRYVWTGPEEEQSCSS